MSPVRARSAPLRTIARATIEIIPPMTARTIEPRLIGARTGAWVALGSAGRGRRLGAAGGQLSAPPDADPVEQVAGDDPQGGRAVDDAPLEADRAGLLEVAGRDGDLAD